MVHGGDGALRPLLRAPLGPRRRTSSRAIRAALIEKGSDRFVELWNLVFMEFNQDGKGGLAPLPSPSIDTGMGLERMAAVLQGKRSNYDTDLFMPLIEAVCESAGREYPAGDAGDVSVRVIADHVRAVTFLIGDGVSPANDGRGYVLRRLIRRAFRNGNLIGIDEPFLYKLTGAVGDIMKDAYPELLASMNYISRVCLAEEERFASTLASGPPHLRPVRRRDPEGGRDDDLRRTGLQALRHLRLPARPQRGAGGRTGAGRRRRRALPGSSRSRGTGPGCPGRASVKQKAKMAYEELKDLSVRSEAHETAEVLDAEVLAVLKDGKRAARLGPGEEGEVVLDRTPIYAEAGGQVGDTGVLKNGRFSGLVGNAYYLTPEIIAHGVKALAGTLAVGDRVDVRADLDRRRAISGNHTATHLLHAALRQVLGRPRQAGRLPRLGQDG